MIIVTGHPRSGTSIMVRLVTALGYFPLGRKFPPGRDKLINPDGFHEDYRFLGGDLLDVDHDSKVVVKVALRPLIERNVYLEPIDKIICIKRGARATAISHQTNLNEASSLQRIMSRVTKWNNEFDKWAVGKDALVIDLETLRLNKAVEINKIKTFIGSTSAITSAVGMVK